jgi:hypothetical protein
MRIHTNSQKSHLLRLFQSLEPRNLAIPYCLLPSLHFHNSMHLESIDFRSITICFERNIICVNLISASFSWLGLLPNPASSDATTIANYTSYTTYTGTPKSTSTAKRVWRTAEISRAAFGGNKVLVDEDK